MQIDLTKTVLSMSTMDRLLNQLLDHAVGFGVKLIAAAVALIIGRWVIKWLLKLFNQILIKREIEDTVKSFLESLISISLKIILFLVIVNILGVSMTSFAAILAAAGLAIGMAMKDNLSNFAGGVMLLINRPFNVGHRIEAQGMDGVVSSIGILYTVLTTGDNRTIFIPNGPLSTGSITNFSAQSQRRIDISLKLLHGVDIEKAKERLQSIIKTNSLILQNPEPFIGITSVNDLSINLTIRLWTNTEDNGTVNIDINEKIYSAFKEIGIFKTIELNNIEYSNT